MEGMTLYCCKNYMYKGAEDGEICVKITFYRVNFEWMLLYTFVAFAISSELRGQRFAPCQKFRESGPYVLQLTNWLLHYNHL